MTNLWTKAEKWFESLIMRPGENAVEVVVRNGDSLYHLSEELTGDGERWPELAAANPDAAFDKDYTLTPGEKLKVPKDWLA